MDEMTLKLARARLTLTDALRGWLFDPNISLVGLGWKEKDGQVLDTLAIRFHVKQKLSGAQLESADTLPIPKKLGAIDTDVLPGRYTFRYWDWYSWKRYSTDPRARRKDPLVGGISISHERAHGYGTLGALVMDRDTGNPMCLSNWHVLVGGWGWLQGQRIYQPGRGDGGRATDTVATLERDAMYANYDAAVARLTGDRKMINEQLDLGSVQGLCQPVLGMEVVKSGRQSSVTFGRITDIEASVPMPYQGIKRVIQDVFVIDQRSPGEQVSAGGDSGSLWLDNKSRCAVGLHFAGQNQPERALAINLNLVLDALNVHLAI